MANLFFPQLSTGALVQYPVQRTKSVSTASTQTEDGAVISYFDPNGSALTWTLTYAGLTQIEVNALEGLFEACCGKFRGFTFIDPLANLLGLQWTVGPTVQASGNVYTNTGIAPQELSQTFSIPSGYTYSFSVGGNAGADPSAMLTLIRRSSNAQQQTTLASSGARLISSGALADTGVGFTVALQLQAGQSVDLSQAQLEAQPTPSTFRTPEGGVYANAHWAVDELLFSATGPNSFSTKFSIETHV